MVRAITQERTVSAEVSGSDRYKYFRRPVTDIKEGAPGERTSRFPLLGIENVASLGIMAPPTTAQKPPVRFAATQVRGTQTDYRESEAQTVPWTPPYTTRGETTPEVLYLDRLKWGDGLPPGRHEVEIVERLRRKRAWDSWLPEPICPENIEIRYKLIEEMEKSDWNFREREIEWVHRERMRKSEQLLEQHNLMNRARLTSRMEYLGDDVNKRKEHKLQIIRHDKERALRKLCMKEKGYDPKKHKMSVLEEHLHHTSQLHAPMRRDGVSFKNRHETLAQREFAIDDEDVCDLIYAPIYKPVFDFNKASKPKKQTELCIRETRWTMDNLVNLHRDLQELRAKTYRDTFYGQVEQRAKPSIRAEAAVLPCAQRPSQENVYQAAIILQRAVHNRAMQALMQQKRDCWKELMQELKISRDGHSEPDISKYKEDTVLRARLAGVMDNLVGLNVGTSIGQTLYLLATELLRFKNEGIAHSQAFQAEAARWRRELPEEGRRQRELRRREEHSLMFAQLLEAYQDSINAFLNKLVAEARENEAKVQAFEHGKEVARLAELERLNRPPPEPEQPVSADLLLQLVAPEGLRELARTCLLILKHKYHQARKCLLEKSGKAGSTIGSIGEPETADRPPSETELSVSDGSGFSDAEPSAVCRQLLEQIITLVVGDQLSASVESAESKSSALRAAESVIAAVMKPLEAREAEGGELLDAEDPLGAPESAYDMTVTREASSFIYSTVSTQLSEVSGREGGDRGDAVAQCRRFELRGVPEPRTEEERLLARVMRDMCLVASSLLHTAANILNKALSMAGIPRESFDEALRRTMMVINAALEEVIGLILPPKPEEKKEIPEELIIEASRIVDEILQRAKERILTMKEEERIKLVSPATETQAKALVEDVIKEAQQKVLHLIVEDFLKDLIAEAFEKIEDLSINE